MKSLTKLVTCFLILTSFSSFAVEKRMKNTQSVNSTVSEYIVRVVVQDLQDSSTPGYDYLIHAYVYADNDVLASVPIPESITVYGTLTLNGVSTPTSITIPTSGYTSVPYTNIPYRLYPPTLEVNYLSKYSLGGIPVSLDPIVFE